MAIKDNVIGKKIRNLRKEKGLTQAELAKNKITRNMLSQIESGIALPSLETLEYIAENLKVPTEYLISSGDDLAYYEKKAVIDKIYRAYEAKGYEACLGYLNTLVHTDNEISFIRANVHFELGKKSLFSGALISAKEHFTESLLACANTVLDTSAIESIIPMYEAVATNIQSPLLEYDDKKYISTLNSGFEYEFYKYLTLDFSYEFRNPIFKLHMEAKEKLRDKDYSGALNLLLTLSNSITQDNYNAFTVFSVYTELELCYKQLQNFEKAYLYSSKRFSLTEGFKS